MAMPIPIIFGNFAICYKELIRRQKSSKKKEETEKAKQRAAVLEQEILSEAKVKSNQVTAQGFRKRLQSVHVSRF